MIYVVRAKSNSRQDTIVGYATGDPDDIKAFFDGKAEYGLYLEEMRVVHVDAGYAVKKARIKQQVLEMRNTAAALERKLEDPTA